MSRYHDSFERRLNRLREGKPRVPRKPTQVRKSYDPVSRTDGRTYYYVHVRPEDNDGKRIYDGPHNSEIEAQNFAWAHFSDKPWEIEPSPYATRATAVQKYRHTLLTKDGNKKVDDVLKRMYRA